MRYFALALLCLFATPLTAQPASHTCARVADPAARLACYDTMYPPSPEAEEMVAEKASASFGMKSRTDPERIESRVLTVGYEHNGARRFTLENGHVWTQADSGGPRIQSGDAVQVRKGLIGSYLLVAPNGVTLRVRRTR